MYLLLSFSPSFYACFSSSVFSVTKVSFVHSLPFPPPSLSCLCNRLYILPHVLNLSLLPLCQFLLCLVFRFPIARLASHMRSYFILHLLSHIHRIHTLLPRKVNFACTVLLPLHWIGLAHTFCFPVCPVHVHVQDLHIWRFGDASQNTRPLYLHSFLPILRLIFSHSQQITAIILSLCFFLSHKQNFLTPVTHHSFLSTHRQPTLTLYILSLLFLSSHSFLNPYRNSPPGFSICFYLDVAFILGGTTDADGLTLCCLSIPIEYL